LTCTIFLSVKKYEIFFQIYVVSMVLVTFVNLALPSDNLKGGKPKSIFNIVLITIDALRADHLSCYGYEFEQTFKLMKKSYTPCLATANYSF